MQELNDWKVVLGFDDTPVKKGMKGVDKAMQRQARLNQTQARDKASVETRSISKQNQLLREQERLRKRIDQARGLGLQGLNKYTGSLAIKDPVRMASKRLELERQIGVAQKSQNIAAKAQSDALKIQKERFSAQLKYQKAQDKWSRQDVQQRSSAARLNNRKAGYLDSLSYLNQRTSSTSSVMPAGKASSLMSRQAALSDQIRTSKSVEELNRLSLSLRQITRDTNSAIRESNKFTREMNRQQFAAKSLTASVHNLARSYLSIYAVGAGAKAFYDIGTNFDSMRAGLLAASGDAVQAQKNFDFLLQTSKNLGVNLVESANGFNKLGIAARSAGFDAAQIQEMHLAIAESAAAFQLDRSKQGLVFLAISQMAAKGRVSLEELQRQLGDSLPTALDAMAKSYSDFIGKTVSRGELIEFVSQGKVMSQDVLPGFAKHLRASARAGGALEAAIKKVRAEQERFMTSIYENILRSFDQAAPLFASAWRDLNEAMIRAAPTFNVFGKAFGGLFKVIAFSIKSVMPAINIFGTALERVFGTFTHFFTTISRGLGDSKQEFTSFEKVLLRLGAQFKYLEAFVYGWLHALDQVSVWLQGSKEDGAFESVAKSIASWGIALIPVLFAFKALAWTLSGILRLVKTISGYNLVKRLLPKESPTGATRKPLSARGAATTASSGALRTALGTIGGPLGKILAAALTAQEAGNTLFDNSTRQSLQENFQSSPLAQGKNQFQPLSFIDMFKSKTSPQPININTSVELDGKRVGESISPIVLDNLYGQMKMENY